MDAKQEGRGVQILLGTGLALALAAMIIGAGLRIREGNYLLSTVALRDLTAGVLPPADAWLGWGVLVLALTPAMRVLWLLGVWIRQRDTKFAFIAGLVLLALSLSIWLGGHA